MANLFAGRNHGFGLLAEAYDHVAAFEAEHFAADHGADTALVGIQNLLAFGIANLLGQELLGGLNGLTTEGGGRDFHFKQVAGLCVFVEFLGLGNQHVFFVQLFHFFGGHAGVVVRIVVHHLGTEEHVDFVLGDFHVDFLIYVEILLGGRNQSLLQGVQHHGIIHVLGIYNGLQGFEQIDFRFIFHELTFLLYLYIHLGDQHLGPGNDHVSGVSLEGQRQIILVRFQKLSGNGLAGTAGHPDGATLVAEQICDRLEGAVKPRRRHFQRVGAFDNFGVQVQSVGQVPTHLGTIVNRNALGLVDIQTHGPALACAEHVHFYQGDSREPAGLGYEGIQLFPVIQINLFIKIAVRLRNFS